MDTQLNESSSTANLGLTECVPHSLELTAEASAASSQTKSLNRGEQGEETIAGASTECSHTESLPLSEQSHEPMVVTSAGDSVSMDFNYPDYPEYEREKFDHEKGTSRKRSVVVKIPSFMGSTQYSRQKSMPYKKVVFIDLSGTLHIENDPTPNAIQALQLLRTNGFKILFVTNTTKESQRLLHERLVKIGFTVDKEEIFTSLNASRNYLEEHKLRPLLMVAEEAKEDFQGIETENPNAVLVGLATRDFNFGILNDAFRLLQDEGAELLAIHKGKSYKTSTGMNLGPGPFVVALEFSTKKEAIVLGKPEPKFFAAAMKFIGCETAAEVVMIGDDVRDDVFGAMQVGITGILVKTGKYLPDDEKKIAPYTPDFVVEDFDTAVYLLLKSVTEGMELPLDLSSARMAEG